MLSSQGVIQHLTDPETSSGVTSKLKLKESYFPLNSGLRFSKKAFTPSA